MHPVHSFQRIWLGFALAALLCLPLGSGEADAQTLQRSAGAKSTGQTGSKRGGSSMTTRSRSSRGPVLPSEEWDADADHDDTPYGSRSNNSSSDDDRAFEPDLAPTLGQACIYGANDQVVYRPRGARCRGDRPVQKASTQQPTRRTDAPAAATRPPTRRSAAFGDGPTKPRRKKKAKVKTSAGCLYGSDGTILFAPARSDCLNGIGAPDNAKLEAEKQPAAAPAPPTAPGPAEAPAAPR